MTTVTDHVATRSHLRAIAAAKWKNHPSQRWWVCFSVPTSLLDLQNLSLFYSCYYTDGFYSYTDERGVAALGTEKEQQVQYGGGLDLFSNIDTTGSHNCSDITTWELREFVVIRFKWTSEYVMQRTWPVHSLKNSTLSSRSQCIGLFLSNYRVNSWSSHLLGFHCSFENF